MLNLFLTEPTWGENSENNSKNKRKYGLKELESLLWSLITSSGSRSELRLWLCNSLSGLASISTRHQRDVFASLLRSKRLKKRRRVAAQLLQLLFQKWPRKAGRVLAKKCYVLEDFFKGNPWRITEWFSNFATTGDVDHRKGAKALSQFAFVNRDICWEELEWKGKHGQSPAMVATKPHYFLDLDVQKTVENFLEYVPEFWSSSEFAESLKDGEILAIDTKFFVELFVDLMYKDDMDDIWEVIDEFLMEESFSVLCRHLLIILEEQELSVFLDLICKYLNPKFESLDYGNPSCLLEIILSKCSIGSSIDDLLFLNAATSQARQLLRLVREEGDQEEKDKMRSIIHQISESASSAESLAPTLEECLCTKSLESVKFLGVKSWALYYRLSEEFKTPQSWESLFVSNGISFRKSDKYALLSNHDGFSKDSGSDSDERFSNKLKPKKKGRRRKKRRKDSDPDDKDDSELVDFDFSSNKLDLQSRVGDWLLSTDGYSTTWNSVDLPEHLSKWMLELIGSGTFANIMIILVSTATWRSASTGPINGPCGKHRINIDALLLCKASVWPRTFVQRVVTPEEHWRTLDKSFDY